MAVQRLHLPCNLVPVRPRCNLVDYLSAGFKAASRSCSSHHGPQCTFEINFDLSYI